MEGNRMIIIKVKQSKRRLWEHYLRKKYHTQKIKLEKLVELLILEEVARQTKKEVECLEKNYQ